MHWACREAIDDDPGQDDSREAWRLDFTLAQRCQTVLYLHQLWGRRFEPEILREMYGALVRSWGTMDDGEWEAMVSVWERVRLPEHLPDTIWAAVEAEFPEDDTRTRIWRWMLAAEDLAQSEARRLNTPVEHPPLTCRTLARIAGITRWQAADILRSMEHVGELELVERGTKGPDGRPTRYRPGRQPEPRWREARSEGDGEAELPAARTPIRGAGTSGRAGTPRGALHRPSDQVSRIADAAVSGATGERAARAIPDGGQDSGPQVAAAPPDGLPESWCRLPKYMRQIADAAWSLFVSESLTRHDELRSLFDRYAWLQELLRERNNGEDLGLWSR